MNTMSKSITINELRNIDSKQFPDVLRQLSQNPDEEQKAVLMDILQYAKDTEFGKKHHFSEIKSIEDFRKQVLVTEHSDYTDYTEKIIQGKPDILFPDTATEFGGTSGTTGKTKIIPESEAGDFVKRTVVKMRTAESARIYPEQTVAGKMKFTITNGTVISTDNQTITSASGQAVARADASAKAKLVVPTELLQIKNIESPDLDYLTMLFGLANKDVIMIICNNLVHFYNLHKLLNKETERFFADIEHGTLSANIPKKDMEVLLRLWKANPKRAAELREIYNKKGCLDVIDFWPSFGMVSCWLSSSVGRNAKEFAYLFPKDTLFLHWGYGATEGKFDIPVEPFSPKGIPALFGYFFEFLELGTKEPVTISETKPNTYYELIVTSYSGLYRYNIHDIITVNKGEDGLYRMEFICKSYDNIVIDGVTLYASELTEYIEKYEAENNIFLRYFRGEDENGKLLLRIEPVSEFNCADFETYIKEKLTLKGIDLSRVEVMPQGSRNKALVLDFDGKIVNQTKLLVFK